MTLLCYELVKFNVTYCLIPGRGWLARVDYYIFLLPARRCSRAKLHKDDFFLKTISKIFEEIFWIINEETLNFFQRNFFKVNFPLKNDSNKNFGAHWKHDFKIAIGILAPVYRIDCVGAENIGKDFKDSFRSIEIIVTGFQNITTVRKIAAVHIYMTK